MIAIRCAHRCEIKREEWVAAVRLCTEVLERPSLLTVKQKVKAHYRRHTALFARQEYDEALQDLDAAAKLDPNNTDVQMEHQGVRWAKKLSDRAQAAQFSGMFKARHEKGEEGEAASEVRSFPHHANAKP